MSTKLVQSAVDNKLVYLGVWTNWSQGSVAGLTLTTTIQNGGLLIAFLALFVTFSGTCFWTIISFVLHQILGRRDPQTASYHQQQAILRNSDTSVTAFWRLSRMSWAWRRHGLVPRRTFLPLVLSLVTFGAFAVAGVFSSRVATTRGGEVLLLGDDCATFNASLFTAENQGLVQAYLASRVRSSANYASTCYADRGSAESCRTFVRSTLPFNVTSSIACPFPGKDRICRSPQGAIRLDSGYINSHHDLGINAPSSQRFIYRSVNECAPVRSREFIRQNITSSPNTVQLWYGGDKEMCWDNQPTCTAAFTLESGGRRTPRNEYSVSMITRYHVLEDNYTSLVNTWKPIPELFIPNADVGVIFLETHDTPFYAPVHDPWFSATRGPFNRTASLGNMTAYLSDEPISVLGCVQQYQFCNPSINGNASCTPLRGIFQAALMASETIFSEVKQRDMFSWSAKAIKDMAGGFYEIVNALKGASLLASDSLSTLGQSGLPDNQWELELEHWFKFTLADVQRAILDQATGPKLAGSGQFHSLPTTAEARTVCSNQKIRTDSFTSFNLLGLVLILSIGGMIMIISAALPCAVERMQRHKKPFASLEWITNDTLQLQRLAHEAVGAGTWDGACNDYPRTRKGELLACLDISNPKHPVLRVAENADLVMEHDQMRASKDAKGRESESTYEPAEAFLLNHEIPCSSLELDRRFTDSMC